MPVVRTAVGFKPERLQLLLAVLAKFVLGRRVHRNDVFVNIVGGLKLEVGAAYVEPRLKQNPDQNFGFSA